MVGYNLTNELVAYLLKNLNKYLPKENLIVMKRILISFAIVLILFLNISDNVNALSNAKKNNMNLKKNKIINIAFFGLDNLNQKTNGRSDSTIILTIDCNHKKLKVTSFMRDLYVKIDGHGFSKLTHAYAYGGPKLAIKTLNNNFGLAIKDYCAVNFSKFEKVIDEVGGVKINVKAEEIKYINSLNDDVSKKKHKKITKSGMQILDGAQALTYTRIRSIGRGDFDRTERQRTLLKALINDANAKGSNAIINLILKLKPYVITNMNKNKITSIGTDYLDLLPVKVQEQRFPIDGYWKNYMSKGVYYLKTNLYVSKKQVMDYIYKDIKPNSKKK